jgi:hypothetical protein
MEGHSRATDTGSPKRRGLTIDAVGCASHRRLPELRFHGADCSIGSPGIAGHNATTDHEHSEFEKRVLNAFGHHRGRHSLATRNSQLVNFLRSARGSDRATGQPAKVTAGAKISLLSLPQQRPIIPFWR